MKIEGQDEFDIPFRVWRKFAARRGLQYQSWEEGSEVLLTENMDRDLVSDFKAFAARVSSLPRPSKILGTSSKEAISGEHNGRPRRKSVRAPPGAHSRSRKGLCQPPAGPREPVASASAPEETYLPPHGLGPRRRDSSGERKLALPLASGTTTAVAAQEETPQNQACAPAGRQPGQRERKRGRGGAGSRGL
ncbi:UXP [Human adenovirus 4]|uniref:UXP n=8 Tax=Human adenovirus E serotype 4 TaxID=28280 RepID=A0A3G8WBY8_ADE04|nr:UXP [Human adenovirus E4]